MPLAHSTATVADSYPLVGHRRLEDVAAYRQGQPVTLAQLLGDVEHAARSMPDAGHVLNLCADRYRFAVTLLASLSRGQTTLLPPAATPNLIRAMRSFAPDVYFVADDADTHVDLPRVDIALDAPGAHRASRVPAIASDQIAAFVFTSGSTGEPQPHAKRWGALVRSLRAETSRLGIGGAGHAILGTVPPQHMFGLESTVLMPLVCGSALTAERLFFPADIDDAIRRTPATRILFTTPFHLRNWLSSGEVERLEMMVSATAPLSPALAREAEERTGAVLFEIYGCTETGQLASRRPTRSPTWEAYDGVWLRDEGGHTWAGGGHIDEPTALSDVIEVEPDGRHFRLLGRAADVVNIAGKRNSIGYLNHQLVSIPGVRDGVFFMPDEDDDGVTRLVAFAVAPGLTAAQVIAHLRSRMDAVFLPRPLVLVDALPRATTGKIAREALRELVVRARAADGRKGA